jgi:ankyrin repeat protein
MSQLLLDAIRKNDIETVAHLIEKGADVNCFDGRTLNTPLLEAIEHGQQRMVHLLLRLGADPNLSGRANETPLHRAVDVAVEIANRELDINGYLQPAPTTIIQMLLEAGASPTSVNESGHTPLDWAQRSGFYEAAALLQIPNQKAP